MRFCDKHWDKVLDAFGLDKTRPPDLQLIQATEKYGREPLLATSSEYMKQLGYFFVARRIVGLDWVAKKMGDACSVCYLPETEKFLDEAIDTVKHLSQNDIGKAS